METLSNKEYRFVCELIWGGVPVDRKWAEESNLFKAEAPKILKKFPMLQKSFFEIAELEETIWPYIRKYDSHWFGESKDGIKMMDPIPYALYQTICQENNYDFMDKALENKLNLIILEVYERERKIYLAKVKKEKCG